jgi:outer membrane lipoprotein-sorting protein
LKDLPKHPPIKLATFFDVKTLLPVRFLGYDADGKLLFDYRYTDIKINTGLKPSDFTPEANGISKP